MTPTQMARRSDALYADGTCGMTRRVLCDMVAQRESDIEDAREENNKLRKELEAAKHDLQVFSANLARLGAENAKLRELCADMNKAAHMLCEAWEGSCSKEAEGMSLYAVCPIGDTNELCVFGRLYDHMRELGIEV